MIAANEARVGNFVMAGKIIVRIESIWNNTELSYREDGGSYREMHFVVSGFVKPWYKFYPYDLKPIPLTSGLLEKCGFVRVGESQEYMFNDFSLVDYSDDDNQFGWFDNGRVCMIPHLHQLQNLYFALTGQELTIKL